MEFDFCANPHLYFGPGKLSRLPELTERYGRTLLLESLVSTKASPMTDALCLSGLEGFGTALQRCVMEDLGDLDARAGRLLAGRASHTDQSAGCGPGVYHNCKRIGSPCDLDAFFLKTMML